MSALDRDAAREVLEFVYQPEEIDALLDALEACVRPAPPQGIDREKAKAVFRQRYIERTTVDQALDYLDRCLRPVEGVVLTPEEADVARRVLVGYAKAFPNDGQLVALAERLESAS